MKNSTITNKKCYVAKDSWQKFAEKINDEGIDNYNKKYYNNNRKEVKE